MMSDPGPGKVDTGKATRGMDTGAIWLDEEDEEANFLNTAVEDESLGRSDVIEDLVITIRMNRIAETGTTAFPSNDVLASLKSCPVTVIHYTLLLIL